jgi:hypothetical protein
MLVDGGQIEVRLIHALCVALDLGAWNSADSSVLSRCKGTATEGILWENGSRLAIT